MASEASDEVDIGCAARTEGADASVGEVGRDVEGTGMVMEGNEGDVCCRANHGWARICAIVNRFEGSTCRILLMRARASAG